MEHHEKTTNKFSLRFASVRFGWFSTLRPAWIALAVSHVDFRKNRLCGLDP